EPPQPVELGESGDLRTTRILYDKLDHAIYTEDAAGGDHYVSYNARGDIAKEWQGVNHTGHPGVATDTTADAPGTVYNHHKLGHQTSVIEPQTVGATDVIVTRSAIFNAFGEITSKSVANAVSGNGTEEFFYDRAGRMWKTNSNDGVYRLYLHNMAGQATAEI